MNIRMISQFFSKYRKPLIYIGVFVIAIFALGDVAFAQTAGEQHPGVGDSDTPSSIVKLVSFILKAIASLIGVFTAFVTLFLSPGWTSGQIFNMQVHLKEIWILVSNVVYFIFAMILIVIAFMNIIGKSDQKWELKQSLPRFIIGVLIVPFSWFFVQFVLSVSAILTVGVLTLPYDTFKEYDFWKEFTQADGQKNEICIHHVVYLGSTGDGTKGEDGKPQDCRKEGSIGDILEDGDNIFGIISIYTYGILSIDDLDTLEQKIVSLNPGAITDVSSLALKVVFDALFVIIYFILLAALFLALFVRGVWLWIYMMLSPAFGLLYFFEKGSEGVGSETKFSIKEFIGLALVPVYVAAALSFGLLFIFVASHGMNNSDDSNNTNFTITNEGQGEETVSILGYNFTIVGFQGKGDKGIFAGVGSALGTIIVELFGVVILWIAVMAALKTSDTTGKIIEPIEQFGSSVGKLVASSPMYAPIIPAGANGERLSAKGLGSAGSSFQSSIDSHFSTSGSKVGQKFAENHLSIGDEYLNEIKNKSIQSYGSVNMKKEGLNDFFKTMKVDRLSDDHVRKELGQVLKRLGANDKLIEEFVAKGKNRSEVGKIFNSHRGNIGWDGEGVSASNQVLGTLSATQIGNMIGTGSSSSSSSGSTDSVTAEIKEGGTDIDTKYEVQIKSGPDSDTIIIDKKKGTITRSDDIEQLADGIQKGLPEGRVSDIFAKVTEGEREALLQKLQEKLKDSDIAIDLSDVSKGEITIVRKS